MTSRLDSATRYRSGFLDSCIDAKVRVADFVPFVTVGRAKKALSISCSLDLNRTAGASAGTARLVE